jgi:hypothetical protein
MLAPIAYANQAITAPIEPWSSKPLIIDGRWLQSSPIAAARQGEEMLMGPAGEGQAENRGEEKKKIEKGKRKWKNNIKRKENQKMIKEWKNKRKKEIERK